MHEQLTVLLNVLRHAPQSASQRTKPLRLRSRMRWQGFGPNSCGGTCGVCGADETCCGGGVICANLAGDENNCSACGNAFTSGETCCDGHCNDTDADEANCGTCGNACTNFFQPDDNTPYTCSVYHNNGLL